MSMVLHALKCECGNVGTQPSGLCSFCDPPFADHDPDAALDGECLCRGCLDDLENE